MESISTQFLTNRFGGNWKYHESGLYAASDDGRYWSSVSRPDKAKKGYLPKHRHAYYQITPIIPGQPKKTHSVHRWIWEVWNGKIPEGYEINHKDCNKLNNALDNLEMLTRQENMRHAKENNRFVSGIREETAIKYEAMKVLSANNWSHEQIGSAFGMSQSAVSQLFRKYAVKVD